MLQQACPSITVLDTVLAVTDRDKTPKTRHKYSKNTQIHKDMLPCVTKNIAILKYITFLNGMSSVI